MTAAIGSRAFINADLIAKLCDGDRQGSAARESRKAHAHIVGLRWQTGTLWERIAERAHR